MDEAIAVVVVHGGVFANLIADLPYAAVNPRIRCEVQEEAFTCPVLDDQPDSQEGREITQGCTEQDLASIPRG